jgi:DNA-binding MarR family transcriptional regulator
MDTQGMAIIDLSRQLNISKQQMTNVIEKLLTSGYVSKNPDPKDRRRLVVTISKKGEKLLAEHMEQFRQRFEIHARNLTTDERQELASILRRYYELINKMFL